MRTMWEHRRWLIVATTCVVAGATLGPPLANAGEEAWNDVIVRNSADQPVPIDGTITLADDGVTILNEAITIVGDPKAPIPVTPTGDMPVRPGVAGHVQLQQKGVVFGDGSVRFIHSTLVPLLVEQLNCFGSSSGLEHVTLQDDQGGDVHEMRFPATDGIVASGPIRFMSDGDELVVIARVRGKASNTVRCLLGGREVR